MEGRGMGEEEAGEERREEGRGTGEKRRGKEGTEQGTEREGRGVGCYEFSDVVEGKGRGRKGRGGERSCEEGFGGECFCGDHFPWIE